MAESKKSLNQLENTLELYLKKKAPELPKNIKELLVNFAPYINLILVLMVLPAVLSLFGFSAWVSSYAFWGKTRLGLMYIIPLIFLIATLILRIMAIKGLFSRSQNGWKMLYYSTLVNLVYSIFNYNLFSGLVGSVIGLYCLFQIKEFYK